MVNFRYHLVSLTAVFLALAAGIAIGAAVVDRATVDLLRSQLDEVERRREETNTRNDELQAAVARWEAFAEQAGFGILDNALVTAEGPVPVLLVAVEGFPSAVAEQLEDAVRAAGGQLVGTYWLTARWQLDDAEAASALAGALDIGTGLSAETVRRAALARLARGLLGHGGPPLLGTLVEHGFGRFDPGGDGPPPAVDEVAPGARLALLGGDATVLPTSRLALPLARLIHDQGGTLVAAQPETPSADGEEGLVGAIRATAPLAANLTTIDTVSDYRSQIALVLAVRGLPAEGAGHFGFGPGATRIVPDPAEVG